MNTATATNAQGQSIPIVPGSGSVNVQNAPSYASGPASSGIPNPGPNTAPAPVASSAPQATGGAVAGAVNPPATTPASKVYNIPSGNDSNLTNAETNSLNYANDLASGKGTASDQSTRQGVLDQFQAQIDATNNVYADQLAQAKLQGQNRIGSNTALQARSGELGSDFGNAATAGVIASNNANEQSIQNKKLADIGAINDKATAAANQAVKDKQAAIQGGLDATLKYYQDAATRKSAGTTAAAKSFIDQGVDPSTLPAETLSTLASNYGTSVGDILSEYSGQKKAADAATLAANQKSEYNLAPGDKRFDATGKLIAYNPPKGTGGGTGGSVSYTDDNGNTKNIPLSVAPYYNTSSSGVGYMDASTIQGTPAEKSQTIREAQLAGIKVITNKNIAADLVNIGDANAKLDTIGTVMAGIAQPGALARDLYGAGLTKLATIAQTNPQKAAAGALQSVGLDILKAVSGVQGFRGNASVVQQVTEHLPTIYDTTDVVNQKIAYIRALISDRENSILGTSGGATKDKSVVEKALNNAGVNYNDFISKSGGKMPVIDNATGTPGYIDPSEYDPNKYTQA